MEQKLNRVRSLADGSPNTFMGNTILISCTQDIFLMVVGVNLPREFSLSLVGTASPKFVCRVKFSQNKKTEHAFYWKIF